MPPWGSSIRARMRHRWVMHAPSTSIRAICGEVETTVGEVSPSARVQVQARSSSAVLAAMPTPPKVKDDGDEATTKTS